MADEPDNLVLRMLREIRAKLDDHDKRFDRLDKRFDDHDKSMELFRFQPTHTFGLAGMANLQAQQADAKADETAARQKRLDDDFKKLEELLSKE